MSNLNENNVKNDILITEGLFSKLTITINSDTVQKLATIPKKDNPLAAVEAKMKEVLNEFEVAYFKYTHKDAAPSPNTGAD